LLINEIDSVVTVAGICNSAVGGSVFLTYHRGAGGEYLSGQS